MDPDADPGSPEPSAVRPTHMSTLGGGVVTTVTTAEVSSDESRRQEALRALAETATKRGIPLRMRDGSTTPASAKPAHARPSPARKSPSVYDPLPSAFDNSPLKPRALLGGRLDKTDQDTAPRVVASSNPFRGGGSIVTKKKKSNDSEATLALELELEKTQKDFARERDALRLVAQKVKRNALEEIQDAKVTFTATTRKLETEKEVLRDELKELTKEKQELEQAADFVEKKCETLFEHERAQALADVEKAREDAREEITRRETVWARERELLKKGVDRSVSLTEKDREHERQRTDRQFQTWDQERLELEARLLISETARKDEHRRIESQNNFRNAVRLVVADKKTQRLKTECDRLVSVADACAKRTVEEATVALDTAEKKWDRQKVQLESDLTELNALRETDRKSFETELEKAEERRAKQFNEFEEKREQDGLVFETERELGEKRRVADLLQAETQRVKERETSQQRAVDAENRRSRELKEAETRRTDELEEAEARRRQDREVFETGLADAEKRRTYELEEVEARRRQDREVFEASLADAETRRTDELEEAEARRVRDREALEQRLADAERRRVSELAEAELRRDADLAAAAEKAAKVRDAMLAAWHQERDEMSAEAEAAAHFAAAALESVKCDLDASGAAADILELERDAARGAADESERVRAEATAFAESWRAEAKKASRAADAARDDAERAILAGRAGTAAELDRLREAHEIRVADAAAALEEERRRDVETTAHAVSAAEAGVSAALEEALSAVAVARQDTRDAAAAFSVTLVLRAWWTHAKHKGAGASEDAVNALVGPKRRATRRAFLHAWFHLSARTKRLSCAEKSVTGQRQRVTRKEVFRAWRSVSPRVTDVARARGAASRRLIRRGFVGWRRVVAGVTARASLVDVLATRHVLKNASFARHRLTQKTLDSWRQMARNERVTRVACNRGVAAACRKRALSAMRDWRLFAKRSLKFHRATSEFVARRRLGALRFCIKKWFEIACAEAHELNVAQVASARFWNAKLKRIIRAWCSVARSEFVERRVIGAYTSRRVRLLKHGFFHCWKNFSRLELREANCVAKAKRHAWRRNRYVLLACVGAWRLLTGDLREKQERKTTCEVLVNRLDATRNRRIAGSVLMRWRELCVVAACQRVTVVRHLARKRREVLKSSMQSWKSLVDTSFAGTNRLLEARLRRHGRRRVSVAFSRWLRLTEAARDKVEVAINYHETHTKRRKVLRPWFALAMASKAAEDAQAVAAKATKDEADRKYQTSVAEADRLFAMINLSTLRIAVNAMRSEAQTGKRQVTASGYFAKRRDVQLRTRVWGLWRVASREMRVALERHAAMRKRNLQKFSFTSWRNSVARTMLERALETRRQVALSGFKKVGAWRLVERVMVAWCALVDDAARGRHVVVLMRKVRVARRALREWKKQTQAATAFHAVFQRVVSAGNNAQRARFFVAWRAGMRHDARDAWRREAKALARGQTAPARHAVRRWRDATRDARLDLVAAQRASRRAVATTWRNVHLGFVAWRCFAGDTEFRHATRRGSEQRAETYARRVLHRRAVSTLGEWRRVACVTPRRIDTFLSRSEGRRVARTFTEWRFAVANGPRELSARKMFVKRHDALVASHASRFVKRTMRSWRGVLHRAHAAVVLATRRQRRRLATATREWRVVATAVALARDDAARRHRAASTRRASSARRVSVFEAWRDRARMSGATKRKLDAAAEKAANALRRRVTVTFGLRVVNEWLFAARSIAVGRHAFVAVLRCVAGANACADAAATLRAWHAFTRETRVEAAQETRRGEIASTLVARNARLMLRSVTVAWHTATLQARRARHWVVSHKLKRNARALRRALETWRRARVLSSRREVPVVRNWQKQIDRASWKRAAAEGMRKRRTRSRLVHARFYAWRDVVATLVGDARLSAGRARAVDAMAQRLSAKLQIDAYNAWRARVSLLAAATKLGAQKGLVRATRRRARCFCAWATLSRLCPRWNLRNAVASRRLRAFGACLTRAGGRVVAARFAQWQHRAAIRAARRAAEHEVAATEAARQARVARDAREKKRAEILAQGALVVAESAGAAAQMNRVVRVDVGGSLASGPAGSGSFDITQVETEETEETDPVKWVSRRLAVDAADAAALAAAAVAARRAATQATNNELLARQALDLAREEIARLRHALGEQACDSGNTGEVDTDPEMRTSLSLPPVPGKDVGVGMSPPVSPRSAATVTTPPAPGKDVGVGMSPPPRHDAGVGTSPVGQSPATSPASSRPHSPAPPGVASPLETLAADNFDVSSPLETLAALNFDFAFSADVSPAASGETSPLSPSGDAPRFESRSALQDAPFETQVLAEKLESALTATAVAESRARVAEAAAVAAEAAAVAAVERSLESHSARESTPVSRNRESETPQTSPRSSLPRSPSWGPPPGSSQQTPSFSPTRSSSFSTPKRQSTSVSPARTRPEWGGSGSIKVDATNMDTREARGRVSLLERRVKTLEKALALSGAKLMTARDAAASAGDLLIETSQRLALLEQDAQRDAGKAQKGTERVGALEARALEAETNLASAQTKARDAETQVLAAEASSDAACAEQQRCRVAMDYAMADAATARDEADTLRAQLDNTTARLDQSETRCVDLAAQLDVWVERGFDVIRSSGSNAAERVVESGSPSEASRLNKHTPTIIGTPDWYAARFESPSLGARSGADAAKWAANAAAETPPLSLLRDLKDAAQSAIGEKTAWKLRAHEAEALVDSLVTTGEAAERATARDASAHEKALEAATQQTRDAETKADAAERRAVDAGRASSSSQKAARAEIAFLVTELAEARETAARAAADAAETRAKAHQRVASKLADAEKKAATAEAAAVAAESLAAAAETRARADVDAAERRAETRVSDLETKASRAVEDFEASKTRERETRAKLEVVRDDVSANKTARAEFEQRVVSLQNELLKTRAGYEEAHVLCRATEQRAETATREFAVAESKAADLTQALEATKTRLDRAVKLNVENEREIEQSRRDVSHLRREAGDAKEISKQFEAKAYTLEREVGDAKEISKQFEAKADTLAKKVTALEAVLVTAEALFAAKARGKTRNANAGTNTDSSPRPPGSVGSFEEAAGGASDVLHLELVETKSALEETRAALREALRENNAGPARPQSPSTPLESASGDDAFSSGDDRGYVFGGARDVRTAQRRTRVDGRDELRVSKVLRRRNRNDTQNDDARKELEEMRLQLFAAAEREQNLRNVNRGLKLAAMAEAMALTGGHPETTGDGRNAPRIPQRDDGLRVAEAALESALLELTGG